MEKQERLKIYQKALKDYRKAFYLGIFPKTKHLPTRNGFCAYFAYHLLHISDLPELLTTQPIKKWVYNSNFWFTPGRLSPRIKCLKKAIKLAKDK